VSQRPARDQNEDRQNAREYFQDYPEPPSARPPMHR
jgi:hypothetical protein